MSANFQEQAHVLQQSGFNEDAVSTLLAAQAKGQPSPSSTSSTSSTSQAQSPSKVPQEQRPPSQSQSKTATTPSPAPASTTTSTPKPLPTAPTDTKQPQKSGSVSSPSQSSSSLSNSSTSTVPRGAAASNANQKQEQQIQPQKVSTPTDSPQVSRPQSQSQSSQNQTQASQSQNTSKPNIGSRGSTYGNSSSQQQQTQQPQPQAQPQPQTTPQQNPEQKRSSQVHQPQRAASASQEHISLTDSSKNKASSTAGSDSISAKSRGEDKAPQPTSNSRPSLQNVQAQLLQQQQQPAKTPVQPVATPTQLPPLPSPPSPTPTPLSTSAKDEDVAAFDDDVSIDNIDQSLVELNEKNTGIPFNMQEFEEVQEKPENGEGGEEQQEEGGMDIALFLGVHSDPGARYGDCNQDSLLCCKTGDNGFIVGVFDGHGVNGEIASDVARQVFEEYFETRDIFSVSKEDQEHMIREVFQLSHQRILETYEELIDVVYNGYQFQLQEMDGLLVYHNDDYGTMLQDFGTTAVIAAVKSNGTEACEIIIANVGDSLALIGRNNKEGGLDAIEDLCEIHNGSNTNERQRVNAFGLSVNTSDSYLSPPPESGFDWAQLAVSRSLGHRYFSEYGVTWEPYISSYSLHPEDRYLVITSDGVTDVLAGDDILKIVTHCIVPFNGDLQRVTMKLVSYCISQWPNEADNTTAIILDLKQTPTP